MTQFDLVIENGRVMDPESGLDAIRHIGIKNGLIEAISDGPLGAESTIDANGLVVAPGFIDLNSHGQDEESYRCQAMDGVTTALALEIGTADVDTWYDERRGKTLIHCGVCLGHVPARMAVMNDPGSLLPVADAGHREATPAEIAEIRQLVQTGLSRGALAVGLAIQYTPAASRWEILEMFRAAAAYKALCYIHLRSQSVREPSSSIGALQEVIAAAAIVDTPVQVTHIQSIGLADAPRLLHMIGEAQTSGLDITVDFYPYKAAMTMIESAMFDPGWRERLGIDFEDLQWPVTGERLTEASFQRFRTEGGPVAIHLLAESDVHAVAASPLTMVATDGLLKNNVGHPRTAGTYGRVLGRFVRQEGILSLMEALRKITLMPAQRLEERAPMMKNKGRLRVGADADLTIFDPQKIVDTSTFRDPGSFSQGIEAVLVDGVPVVRGGRLQEGVTPGRAIRAP